MGTYSKPKTDAQIIKWLKSPHADSAEYKLWGNGVALSCLHFVLVGIVITHSLSSNNPTVILQRNVLKTLAIHGF